jgi:hypothetical protein
MRSCGATRREWTTGRGSARCKRLPIPLAALPVARDGEPATFGAQSHGCPLRAQYTTAETGRTITINRHEQRLTAQRARQRDPAWQAAYQANRPKVERKLGHLVRRWHGGRRARMRGDDASPKTGSCSPTPTMSPAWPSSACTKPSGDGKPPPFERGSPGVVRPPPRPPGPHRRHRGVMSSCGCRPTGTLRSTSQSTASWKSGL